jgi:4a-hydroxytetrahydrobiopterin dehydratase
MAELKHLKCVPCRGGEPPLAEDKIQELISQVPEWEVIEVEGIKRLQRTFKFKNFVQALGFTNRVGEIAEQQDHHPVLITQWGKVTVTWWTHVIKGLHQNDFIMAAKTDELYSE